VSFARKTASKDRVKFDPAVAHQEPEALEPLAEGEGEGEGEGEVAGLVHCPFASGVRGDAAEVHPAGAVDLLSA
jgi:hypothetical protein